MIKALKTYWLEGLVLSIISGVLLITLAPSITWMNTDSDGAHYILAAKYLTTAHHMSAPLYLLLGHVFLWLPFGTEAWRMGLISVLGTIGSTIFIYLILRLLLKDNPKARLYAIISCLVFGGSALVISQSTIIETYSLATMCAVGAYYFTLKKKWIVASVMLGLGLAIHPFLAFIAWAVLFVAHKEMRNWRRYMVTIAFFSFYLYIPLVKIFGNDLGMWGNTSAGGFFGGTMGMVLMLVGGLSMWDFPKRVIDTILILLVSFGLGIVPMVWYFIKVKKWQNSLLWLVLIPIIFFAINLATQTYVYLIVSIAFGSIAVGLGLSKLRKQWAFIVLAIAILLMGYNTHFFDIGRTLDSEMSAVKFYEEELAKIPDGEIFMGGGWTWAMVYLYNIEEDRDIVPVCTDILSSDEYLGILEQEGVKLVRSNAENQITYQGEVAQSIAMLNDGVWIAKEIKPEVYQYVVEPAKDNEDYIGRWIGQEVKPEWRWKPSNPYKFISGQLEIIEWHHVLVSNINMLFVIVLAMLGYGMVLVLLGMRKKRKEDGK